MRSSIGTVLVTGIGILGVTALLFIASYFPRPVDLIIAFVFGLWFAGAPAQDHWNMLLDERRRDMEDEDERRH